MKEKIKRFIDCNVPTQVCNLKCPYCYVGQVDGFSGKIKTINHSPEEVRKALSRTRMGGTILINFCGTGETLLGEDILPIVLEILKEGHYVQIVTNGTITKRFDEIIKWNREYLDRLLIKFSYHYSEFVRLNLLDVFFDNVVKVRDAGCSISVEITSGDGMVEYIEEMKKVCMERCGALPHVTVARNNADPNEKLLTKKTVDDYRKTWSSFDSPLFDVKMDLYGQKRCEYCYAGEWTFYLYLSNGDLKQCYKGEIIDNIFEDINRPIRFKPIGFNCKEPYCFNGHAWLTLGSIPRLDLPRYSEVRDRHVKNGKDWLSERTKAFISQKLEDNNTIYTDISENPKVLLVGDSISKGYREFVKEKLEPKWHVFFPETITTFSTYFLRYIQEFAEGMKIGSNVDVVYFNTGLWDVIRINGDDPLIGSDVYKNNMERIVMRLKYIFPNAKLIFATTTIVNEADGDFSFFRLNNDILNYNDIAIEVMKANDVLVHDLSHFAYDNLKNEYVDFTHFTEEGYLQIAEEVVGFINNSGFERKKIYNIEDRVENVKYANDLSLLNYKRIVVYGAGDYGEKVIEELKKVDIIPSFICDKNKVKQGNFLYDIEIISPEKYICNYMDIDKDVVIIAIKNANGIREVIENFNGICGISLCTYKILGIS